jgi:hypothetical protein
VICDSFKYFFISDKQRESRQSENLSAKVEILKFLSLKDENEICKGYMTFQEGFEIYASHTNSSGPFKDDFLLSLLHEENGLPVNIVMCKGVRYIILRSSTFDYVSFLDLIGTIDSTLDYESKITLDRDIIQNSIKTMDTEWDKFVLKVLLAGNKTHTEMEKLGLRDKDIATKFETMQTVIEEVQNAQLAAEDMVALQLKAKIDRLEKEISDLYNLIKKVEGVWESSEVDKKQLVIQEKKERVESTRNKLERNSDSDDLRFKTSAALKAKDLIEENRLKRRSLGAGTKRKLDSEAEDFIVNCIEEKGEAHPRRHDSIVRSKRIKYDDLFELTNKHLSGRNKPQIKSRSTIQLLSKPRHKSSREAKLHHGRGLFCTKKPSKSGCENNVNTHHQRAQVKLLREELFSNEESSKTALIISMDDKASLKPGTDIGMKGARKGKILATTDSCGTLPQHDFSESKVQITPSSFRFMTKKTDDVSQKLVRDDDQSVVVIRPKYYTGSSGSVWASDYLKIAHEYPHLYTEKNEEWVMPIMKLGMSVSDHCAYFLDTTEKDDIERVKKGTCIYKDFEVKRVTALHNGIKKSIQIYEATEDVPDGQKESISKMLLDIQDLLTCTNALIKDMSSLNGFRLGQRYQPLIKLCQSVIDTCDVHLPQKKKIVGELTDAGPGVGVSNYEVKFRMAEVSRMHKTVRRTRVHRATGDSGQNESERTNACIGEALVDGGPLCWDYFNPQSIHTMDELKAMTQDQLEAAEEECMEKNAWRVCEDVCQRVHMEPGPAGDMMLCMVEDASLFFYNTKELVQYQKSPKGKRKALPGYHYFKKIENFIDEHGEKGELFIEFRLGRCTKDGLYSLCEFCQNCNVDEIGASPRPFPDYASRKYKYLPLEETPRENRDTDDFATRKNLKDLYNKGQIETSKNAEVKRFCEKFIVEEQYVIAHLHHMEWLNLKKMKRVEKRLSKMSKPKHDEPISEDEGEDELEDPEVEEVIVAIIEPEVTEQPSSRRTRSGRQCTTYRDRHFYGDSD